MPSLFIKIQNILAKKNKRGTKYPEETQEFCNFNNKKTELYKNKIVITKVLEFLQSKGQNKNIKDYSLFEFYSFIAKKIPADEL